MKQAFNNNLLEVLNLSEQMLHLAERGDRDRNDASCGILYGILRDSAYRLRALAQRECDHHRDEGKWDEDPSVSVGE